MRISLAFHALVTLVLLLPLPGLCSAVYVDAEREWNTPPSSTRELASLGTAKRPPRAHPPHA